MLQITTMALMEDCELICDIFQVEGIYTSGNYAQK